MEESHPQETSPQGLNKIDLSQLQDFQFGTQWTEAKLTPASAPRRERDREPRRDRPGRSGGELRRDRRGFRRPAGAGADDEGTGGPRRDDQHGPADGMDRHRGPRYGRPPRREGEGDRRFAGPPRFQRDQRPYQSPFFNIAFYPEDAGFSALVKAMRASCRTFELFEITRLILEKPDRFVVVVTRHTPETSAATRSSGGADAGERAPAGPVYVSVPDGMPHETEEAAIAHVVARHLDRFFDLADVEVEPPKGNFPFVNRCTLSGELLGPPNYHRYAQIVQQHHAARYPRMSLERFREHIETVRDPEVVAQWMEQMKRATRYTWKPAAPEEATATFDNFEDARAHLLANGRDRMLKAVESCRFHARLVEQLPAGEIRRAIEGQLERQRRFPLDTANALRGRLRREGFTIFKKGAKGISYVCAVKRKFRVPGQSFAESINTLITFLETNPMITIKELPVKLLGITPPVTLGPPPARAPSMSTPPMAPAESAETAPSTPDAEPPSDAAPAEAEAPAPPSDLSAEEQEKLRRLTMDLHWLVHEGYVTEFGDGRLFAAPPMVEPRSKTRETSEADDHDLENFPEASPAEDSTPVAGASGSENPPPEPAAETEPSVDAGRGTPVGEREPAPSDAVPISEAPQPAPPADTPPAAAAPVTESDAGGTVDAEEPASSDRDRTAENLEQDRSSEA